MTFQHNTDFYEKTSFLAGPIADERENTAKGEGRHDDGVCSDNGTGLICNAAID